MDQEEVGVYFLVFKFSGSAVEVLICSEMIGEVALALASFFIQELWTQSEHNALISNQRKQTKIKINKTKLA